MQDAQVHVADRRPLRDGRLDVGGYAGAGSDVQLAVEDRVHHDPPGLDDRVDRDEVVAQLGEVGVDLVVPPERHGRLQGLDMVAVVVPPAPHFLVHGLHFVAVLAHQVALVRVDPFVDPFLKKHFFFPSFQNSRMISLPIFSAIPRLIGTVSPFFSTTQSLRICATCRRLTRKER